MDRAQLALQALKDVEVKSAHAAAERASRREALEQSLQRVGIDDATRLSLLEAFKTAERNACRELRRRVRIDDFEILRVIGRGAFGEVCLCRSRIEQTSPVVGGTTHGLFALKILDKPAMLLMNQLSHTAIERRALQTTTTATTLGVVTLHESFQSADKLFLVLDYIPGGDLMSLLIAKDVLTEDHTRLIAAELCLAIEGWVNC